MEIMLGNTKWGKMVWEKTYSDGSYVGEFQNENCMVKAPKYENGDIFTGEFKNGQRQDGLENISWDLRRRL